MAAYMSHLLKPWSPSVESAAPPIHNTACLAKLLRANALSYRLTLVRWSRYNPYYLEPETNRDVYMKPETELTAEETEERELKKVRPIKAAVSGVSSSGFNDQLINKFVNMMMQEGKKVLAREIMSETLESIKRKQVEKFHKAGPQAKMGIECNPYTIFHQALENCMPVIGLASIQRGGKFYQVPIPLTDKRRRFLAMKWMITECRNKHRRTHMYEKLSQELLTAFSNEGSVIRKKHELHKMAEANRAYAHYRWW